MWRTIDHWHETVASFQIEDWHRNLAAVWLAHMITFLAFSFVSPFIPLYVQSLGVKDNTQASQWSGLIFAGSSLTMAIMQPIWGNLADRWGCRPMLIRSLIGGSVTTVLMGLAAGPEQLLVFRTIQGATLGTTAAANALVSANTPRHRLGFALGVLQMAAFIGISVGPLVAGVIADTFGYRASFFVAAALMVVGATVVVALVREHHVRPQSGTPQKGVLAGGRSLMAVSLFPVLISVVYLLNLGNVIVSPMLSLFIAELSTNAGAATSAGIVLAATGFASAISAILLGRISDRVGHTTILMVCLLGAAITYFPQAFVDQVWQLLALRVLLGFALGGLMPSAFALLAKVVPPGQRGASFGLAAAAQSLATGSGPLVGAGIGTLWGMRSVFLATGILYMLAFGWVSLKLRRYRPQSAAGYDRG